METPHCSWFKVMHLTTCTKLYWFYDQWEKYSYVLPLFIAHPQNKASKHCIPGIKPLVLVLGSTCHVAFDCLQYAKLDDGWWEVLGMGTTKHILSPQLLCACQWCYYYYSFMCVVLCMCPLHSLNDLSLHCRMKEGAVGNLNLASRRDQGRLIAVQKDQYQGTYTLTHNSITIVCGVAIWCMPSLSKYFPVTHSSDTPMSPAVGDIDLIGFYPSLSRDGAVVSGKHSGTTTFQTCLILCSTMLKNISWVSCARERLLNNSGFHWLRLTSGQKDIWTFSQNI